MPNAVALDVGNIPSNSVTLLSSLSPLLKALSADNVVPLTVVQAEALGACFHINGKFAARVPDLLVRSTSMRLQRLSMWVGWMAGDTASVLAPTAGGRAIWRRQYRRTIVPVINKNSAYGSNSLQHDTAQSCCKKALQQAMYPGIRKSPCTPRYPDSTSIS
jgi:hypothetical protein